METPVELAQDVAFINSQRSQASTILDVTDLNLGNSKEWNNLFGGASRLTTEAFTNQNDGLNKTDISDALTVIIALNTFLDTDSNRAALEKIRNPR